MNYLVAIYWLSSTVMHTVKDIKESNENVYYPLTYRGQTLNIHKIPAIIPLKKGIPHAKKTKNRPSRLPSC